MTQHRIASDLRRRLTGLERELASAPGWRDRGAPAILAEAAVRLVREMRRRGDEFPPAILPELVTLFEARSAVERFADHDNASAALAEALRLYKAGRENEALAALYGPAIT